MCDCTSCVIRIYTLKYCRKEKDALARRMDDVKRKISRISYVKYLTLLTSKDDVLVAAKNGPKNNPNCLTGPLFPVGIENLIYIYIFVTVRHMVK